MGSADSALNQTPPALSQPVISVFGSSRCTEASDLYQLTRGLGDAIARAGFAVATGGYGGVMEAVSRGAAESGGIVIGVVDHAGRSKANQWLSERIVVDTWRQRLHTLMDLGDGYVVCQGGTGTLVELAVAWEILCKGVVAHRPLVALGEFWNPVLDLIASAEDGCGSEGLVRVAVTIPEAMEVLTKGLSHCWEG